MNGKSTTPARNAPERAQKRQDAPRSLAQVRARLNVDYDRLRNWQAVADEWKVSKGLAYRVARSSYEPKSPNLRAKLGLPPTATVVSVDGAIPDGTQVPGHAICVQCGAPFTPNVHNRTHCYHCVKRGGKEKHGD